MSPLESFRAFAARRPGRRRPLPAPGRWLALASALTLGLLVGLVWVTERQAERAVREKARTVATVSARVSAEAVRQEIGGLRDLVEAYAQRRSLADALARGRFDASRAQQDLKQLQTSRPDISVAFLARLDGRLIDVVPFKAGVLGRNFAFRDWYRGVRRTGSTYVSEAYVAAATGLTVVSAAAVVRRDGRPVGILSVAYDVRALQRFTSGYAGSEGVSLAVTDQRGVLVAGAAAETGTLVSRRSDPLVRSALTRREGVVRRRLGARNVISAFAPVSGPDWAVVADLDERRALTGVGDLRRTQLLLGLPLLVSLVCGVASVWLLRRHRARAETGLRSSQHRARSIVQTAPEAFVAVEADGTICDFNPAAERLFGWSAPEALGRPLADTIALTLEDDGRRVALTPADLGEVDPGARVLARGRRGRTAAVELAMAPGDEASSTLNLFIRDVSARDRADARARAQAGVTRALAEYDRLHDAREAILAGLGTPLNWSLGTFWTLDRTAQRLTCESVWRRPGFGAEAFEATTRHRALAAGAGLPGRVCELGDVVWVPDVADCPFFTRGDAAVTDGLHAAVGIPIRDADGVCGVMEFFDRRLAAPDQDLLAVLATASEQIGHFLARERAEELVRSSEERLRTILENTPAVVSLKDAAGRHVMVNRAFEAMLGVSSAEIVGRTAAEALPPDLASAVDERDAEVLRTGRALEAEAEVILPGGERRTLLSLKFPLADAGGRSDGVGSISTDITERKLAEQALQTAHTQAVETSRLKSEFVANMSHELRTPLNGVIGMTGLLLATDLDEEQTEYVQMAQRAGEALLGVISDVLDFSKIEAGKLELDPYDFDLREVVSDSCVLAAEPAFAKSLELLTSVDPALAATYHGDGARLRQVLTNLVANAVKFTQHGEVVVRVTGAPGDRVRFEVTDTGVGIDEEHKARLWEAFSQADSSTTRLYGGTGLGLTISRQIVERMGGAITVESELGRGSTFEFSVPLARATKSAEPAGDHALAGRRILAVDDNATNRSILGGQLTALGADVVTVAGGQEALETLDDAATTRRGFDLVVVDFDMPGMDGIELARRIQARPESREVPLVMLASSGAGRPAARDAGVGTYLTKPVRPDHLSRALSDALGHRATSPDRAREPALLAASPTPPQAGGRVLLAEDNSVNQVVARVMLERMGYDVDLARDGAEAVNGWSTGDYRAVLMDCQMPQLDGYQATQRIRELEGDGPRTPIIAMTANALKGDRERCLAAGMDDYVAKPIDGEALREALVRWTRPGVQGDDGRAVASVAAEGPLDGLYDLTAGRRLHDDLPPDVLRQVVALFVDQTPSALAALEAAIARDDADELWRAAHKLKGSCRAVGATGLARSCAELEERGRRGETAGAQAIVSEMVAALGPTVEIMRVELVAAAS